MNQSCKTCGGKCCKTLMFSTAQIGAEPLELLRTRAVAEDAETIWINCGCKHLTDDQCGIYEHRPSVCSGYPVHGAACQSTRKAVR